MGTGVVLMVGFFVLEYTLWRKFAEDYIFFTEQRPAMCVDGRSSDQPISAAKYVVDDSKRSKSSVTMRCGIPVSVYPCTNVDAELKAACAPAAVQKQWPTRIIDTDITCAAGWTISGSSCTDSDWECTNFGACDAYEKARRLCAHELILDSYFCYHVPDHEDFGILIPQNGEDKRSWPVGWLIGGICGFILWLFTCCSAMHRAEHLQSGLQDVILVNGVAAAISGFIYLITWAVKKATGYYDKDPIEESSYKKLADMMWPNNVPFPGGPANHTLVPEDPVSETTMWWHYALIAGGIVAALCCIFSSASQSGFFGFFPGYKAWNIKKEAEHGHGGESFKNIVVHDDHNPLLSQNAHGHGESGHH